MANPGHNVEQKTNNFFVRKVLLSILPALLFCQNYAWMTVNVYIGIAFWILLAFIIWNVWSFTDKNHILQRVFRLAEIGFFLFPISAIISSFVMGSQAITATESELEQAGAAVGTLIGGTVFVIVALIIGIIGGIIMHIVANQYSKKLEQSKVKSVENLATKHGVILTICGLFFLAIVLGSISSEVQPQPKISKKSNLSQSDTNIENKIPNVSVEILDKSFYEADFMSGEYEDKIIMELQLTNHTSENIKGVKGELTFYDIFDEEITTIELPYEDGLTANEEKVWPAEMSYNEFMNEHQKLKNTDLEDLKYKWELDMVVYSDGTTEAL